MIQRRPLLARLAALATAGGLPLGQALAQAALATATAGPFEFVALGDMPYGPDAIAGPAYRHLIDLINQAAPPFAIHVGDFRAAPRPVATPTTSCSGSTSSALPARWSTPPATTTGWIASAAATMCWSACKRCAACFSPSRNHSVSGR